MTDQYKDYINKIISDVNDEYTNYKHSLTIDYMEYKMKDIHYKLTDILKKRDGELYKSFENKYYNLLRTSKNYSAIMEYLSYVVSLTFGGKQLLNFTDTKSTHKQCMYHIKNILKSAEKHKTFDDEWKPNGDYTDGHHNDMRKEMWYIANILGFSMKKKMLFITGQKLFELDTLSAISHIEFIVKMHFEIEF